MQHTVCVCVHPSPLMQHAVCVCVHPPPSCSMLEEYDMEFVHRQGFIDFFHERRHHLDDADLLFKMSAFDKQTVSELTIAML